MQSAKFTTSLRHNPTSAIYGHGWPRLYPFESSGRTLTWTMILPQNIAADVALRWSDRTYRLRVHVSAKKISDSHIRFIRSRVRWMFRADERFDGFWQICARDRKMKTCAELRFGALLRSPTLFEDLTKTICTVNCHWRNTKQMVRMLCENYGMPAPTWSGRFSFPKPDVIAQESEHALRRARLGFRARYIKQLSEKIAGGEIDLQSWTATSDCSSLRDTLLALPGIGPYAANHLLMLLGHYGHIPCDSEVCAYLKLPPGTPQARVEGAVSRRYRKWGRYAFLGYKFERVLARNDYIDC